MQALNPKDTAVLMVEDDPDDATTVGRALQSFGIRKIHLAETAEDALRFLTETGGCDVVLLDYNLPGMNGLRLLERIRQLWPRMPVVVVTGQRDESIVVLAMKAGAADYVAKDDLLTSHVIRSLQAALRTSIDASAEEQRTVLASGAEKLNVSIAEIEWQLDIMRGTRHEDQAAVHRSADYGEEDLRDLMASFGRYLQDSFESFPRAARSEQEALGRMFIDRGSSPAEITTVYLACLRALLLEDARPPFDPLLALVQLLAHVVDEYQMALSLSALGGSANEAFPRIQSGDARARAA